MNQRCLFLAYDVSGPTGGISVIYEFARTLRQAGVDAGVVHQSPAYEYQYEVFEVPTYYTHSLRRVQARRHRRNKPSAGALRRVVRRARLGWQEARLQRERTVGGRSAPVALMPSDVLIVPERMYGLASECFPEARKVLLVQGHFILFDEWVNATRAGLTKLQYEAYIGTSEACETACTALGMVPTYHVPLAVDSSLFAFSKTKRMQIAYMPRKRRDELELVIGLLRQRGRVEDVEFVPVDGMPRAEVARVLGESLIFLSMSYHDGFGLPPAEAMAAGCLVIGYTGQGGAEFFDEESGMPIEDNEPLKLVATVEEALAEYKRSPERIDKMRRVASARIRERYNYEAMRGSLLSAWEDISTGRGRPT